MEENTILSNAEEQNTPQENETSKTEGKKELVTVSKTAIKVVKKTKVKSEETEHNKENDLSSPEVDLSSLTLEALIDKFELIVSGERWIKHHNDVQTINKLFEEKFQKDLETQKKSFTDGGGNEIDFFYKPEYKKRFDEIGYDYRKKRREHYKDQEVTQKVNLERKQALIEEIKNLINIDQNINTIYKTFRTLQENWYNIGMVPRTESQNLWETYKHHVEKFYDFLHLNRELRDLDYKHNYEEKLKIIEQAEILQEVGDVLRASRDLNILHQLWKNDLGPVAKEHRDVLWARFQEASKVIQVKRQAYQKDMVGAMKENLYSKETLLKEMKTLSEPAPKNHKEWQNAINRFNTLRDQFKGVGYVPAKESKTTWQKFREIGREFMQLKNVFYKDQKKEYNQNIDKKKNLIQTSKEILESETWDSKTQEMKDIQSQWRTIGFVPRKLDNKFWTEFSDIHKVYFDRLKSGYQKLSPEQETLHKEKLNHIEKLKAAKFSNNLDTLKKEYLDYWDSWQAFSRLDSSKDEKMNLSFSNTLLAVVKKVAIEKKAKKEVLNDLNLLILQSDPDRLQQELQEARTIVNSLKSELTQLENNLEFFSNSSSENPLFKNVEKQIKSCQNKISKAQEDYIHLKQVKNSQDKSARKTSSQELESSEEN
jgi:hypothetical protein